MAHLLLIFEVTSLILLISIWCSSSQINDTQQVDKYQNLCEKDHCEKVETAQLLKFYRGLFFTQVEITQHLNKWAEHHRIEFKEKGLIANYLCNNPFFMYRQGICKTWNNSQQDYDLCCPTRIYHKDKECMVNAMGDEKTIVKLKNPDRVQFIPQAECLSNGTCSGFGKCRLDNVTIWLAVIDIPAGFPYIKFDPFEIPGYCSCKSN